MPTKSLILGVVVNIFLVSFIILKIFIKLLMIICSYIVVRNSKNLRTPFQKSEKNSKIFKTNIKSEKISEKPIKKFAKILKKSQNLMIVLFLKNPKIRFFFQI